MVDGYREMVAEVPMAFFINPSPFMRAAGVVPHDTQDASSVRIILHITFSYN